ncbi:MAG: YggS family pyridoxal phosphate-dependent enzyme [Brevundimonas sp.]|uniref:YggS family pyridoxal phosphate-dependent enzyme n=1 Tax=Brevundimonas sp. TaxID=1871086 RepID=UPI00391BCDF9
MSTAIAGFTEQCARINHRIARAARAAGREGAGVTLVAVSKQQPEARIEAALAAGQRVFGENRVQEAAARWAHRREGLQLRLIGQLQSNKAEDAVALFDAIESLDRPSLARALAEAMDRLDRRPEIFVQVNTGAEPQKGGVLPGHADAFIATLRRDFQIEPAGLMVIPPMEEEPAMHFALLARIAARNGISRLSMGMSGDFETAVRLGATHVRIGSELFGPRPLAIRTE